MDHTNDDFRFCQLAAPSAEDGPEANNISSDIGGINIKDEKSKESTGVNEHSNKRRISLNEVKQHHSEGSMWTILKGRVYNLSPYMKIHPGGVNMLMKAVGKDCTSLFNKYHPWVNYEFFLGNYLVGILDDGQ